MVNEKVVEVDFRDKSSLRAKKKKAACNHLNTELDLDSRTVNCVDCGEVLDPIKVLLAIAEKRDYV